MADALTDHWCGLISLLWHKLATEKLSHSQVYHNLANFDRNLFSKVQEVREKKVSFFLHVIVDSSSLTSSGVAMNIIVVRAFKEQVGWGVSQNDLSFHERLLVSLEVAIKGICISPAITLNTVLHSSWGQSPGGSEHIGVHKAERLSEP